MDHTVDLITELAFDLIASVAFDRITLDDLLLFYLNAELLLKRVADLLTGDRAEQFPSWCKADRGKILAERQDLRIR